MTMNAKRMGLSPRLLCCVLAGVVLTFLFLGKGRHPEKENDHIAGFKDVAEQAGINFRMRFLPLEQGENFKGNLYDHGSGLAVGDFDGDGFDDIYFLNQLGQNALYRNQGDGTFIDVTRQAGVGMGDRICVSATWADYDNDGHADLFVTSTRGGNVLFRNQGDGTFKDVTKQAGVHHVGHSQIAVFFDHDNDGHLDLLVTHTAKWTMDDFNADSRYYPGLNEFWDLAGRAREYNILYRNNGDGTFSDLTDRSGLKGKGWASDVAVFDFDQDGFLDVLVTNMFGRSQLYRNDGKGAFMDVTEDTLRRTSWGAAGCKVFDFNNDGKLDLYIVDMHSDMWMPHHASPEMIAMIDESARYPLVMGLANRYRTHDEKKFADLFQIRYGEVIFGNTFFKNLGGGKFTETASRVGLETWWPWGIACGDFDNDGFEDVFVAAGMGYPYFYWPNSLLVNNGDETFSNRARELGIEPPALGEYLPQRIGGRPAVRSSRACAVADFDGDGRLEIVTNNFNDRPYYFKNNLPRKNHVAFRLRGTTSNRDATGATVRLFAGNQMMTRLLQPTGGYLSQSSRTIHFGLGNHTSIDRIEIDWPSGKQQILRTVEINKTHAVTEPS